MPIVPASDCPCFELVSDTILFAVQVSETEWCW